MVQILLIGAGNLGSRHLQALKQVSFPLKIGVIDPSKESLQIAKERYDSLSTENIVHEVVYLQNIPEWIEKIEVAIIATNSNIRKMVIEELLSKNNVQFLILEKILFQNKSDYTKIQNLLQKSNTEAFVNCPMRMIPFFRDNIKKWFGNKKIIYFVSGSQYGLITSSIHYIDFMSFLANSTEFEVNTSFLEKEVIESKRSGFLELNGILQFHFDNGSHGIFSCNSSGNLPFLEKFTSDSIRCIVKDTENKALIWNRDGKEKWNSLDFSFLYQSQLTNLVVEELIENNSCPLTPYDESMIIHLKMLESLKKFLKSNNNLTNVDYPFT